MPDQHRRIPTHATRFRRKPMEHEDEIPHLWRIHKDEIVCAGKHGCYEAMYWSSRIQVTYFDGKLPEYCPHCGARMEEGERIGKVGC